MSLFDSIFETIKDAVTDPVCTAFKTSPQYWQLVAFLNEAKARGVISDQNTCSAYAKTSGFLATLAQGIGVGGITEEFVGCACKKAFAGGSGGVGLAQFLLQPNWTTWDSVGGSLKGRPAVIRAAGDTREVTVRWTDDELRVRVWSKESGWADWRTVHDSIKIASDPAVVTDGLNSSLFVTVPDGRVFQYRRRVPHWQWVDRGGRVKGSVAALMLKTGEIDVYARGMNDEIWENRTTDGEKWSGWVCQPDRAKIYSSPTVVSTLRGYRDIFFLGAAGQVMHKRFLEGYGVSRLRDLGGQVKGEVAAVALAPNVIELYVRGMDDALYQNWTFDGDNWHGWERHNDGGVLASSPTVVVSGIGWKGHPVREVYVREVSGGLSQKTWC